jgi:hypothetical protein
MARELKWKAKFLSYLAKTCNVSRSARLARVGRRTAYDHRKRDAKFAADWEDAEQTGIDALEFEARRRALDGCLEPVFYKGDKCGSIRKYSDLLTIFLLKAHRPEKYRDNYKQEREAEVSLADLVSEAESRAEARKRERESGSE